MPTGTSNFPSSLDNLPATRNDSDWVGPDTVDHAAALNAIEAELGINPSGSEATVGARLTAVESGGRTAINSEAPLNIDWPEYANLVADKENGNWTPAIQAALNAVDGKNGAVFVPARATRRKTVAPVAGRSGTRLFGEGYGSWIQKDTPDNDDVIEVDGKTDFEIDHLRVRNASMDSEALVPGNGTGFGIRVTNDSRRGHVHHNFVENSWLGIGVLDVSLLPCHDISVDHNVVVDTGCNGISVGGIGATGIAVDHNFVRRYGQRASFAIIGAGIEWAGPIGGSCSFNTLRDGNYSANRVIDAIRVSDRAVRDLMCIGNDMDNFAGYGIRVATLADRCVFAHNTIANAQSSGSGIYFVTTADGDITNCLIAHNAISGCPGGAGVLFENSDAAKRIFDCRTMGNVISECYDGITLNPGVAGVTDCDFIDDMIRRSVSYGVVFHAGARNRLRGVTVRDSVGYGFHIGTCTEIELIECHAYDKRAVKLQTYGLNIDGSAVGTQVVGGRYGPNLTGTVQNGSGSTVQTGVRAAYT